METAELDYDLPPERIAQVPAEPRDAARLLVDRGDGARPGHALIRDLPELLAPGDLVVVNDTRVLPARLRLRKATGGTVEVLLLERRGDGWEALVRPSRRVGPGTTLAPAGDGSPADAAGVGVEVLEARGGGRWLVRLTGVAADRAGDVVDRAVADRAVADRAVTGGAVTGGPGANWAVADRAVTGGAVTGGPGANGAAGPGAVPPAELAALAKLGEVPLPPYITTPLADPERYQTVFARRPGSAAAPTAGLHLTPDVLARLESRDVAVAAVELAVGLGTFRPIATDQVEDHVMHGEAYRVPPATWQAVTGTRAAGGRVVAVGTTVVRALETVAAGGGLEGRTELFIRGDHPFGAVDRLVTNFHTPRSSLLALVAAFVGPRWRSLYDEARAEGYRFLSFGDAMLLTRGPGR